MTRRWTARAMAAGVRADEVSAVELVSDALAGVTALDPVLHFMDFLAADSALEAAARIDGIPLVERRGPDPRDPTALPHWPLPVAPGDRLRVGFSADLGYAQPDAAVAGLVAGRLQELAAAGIIGLREVTLRLADPEAAWLPLAAWLFSGRENRALSAAATASSP